MQTGTRSPVSALIPQILSTLKSNQAALITGATGSGKSINVPLALMQAGYRVLVTEPRRLVCQALAERAAQSVSVALGEDVGYWAAGDRCADELTRLLYTTDGLQVVLSRIGIFRCDVLIIDEIHEWNRNMEFLLALAWRYAKAGKFKLVVMSATCDEEPLAKYLGNAPVIKLGGKGFEITELAPGPSILDEVLQLIAQKKNTLVFFPRRRNIERFISELRSQKVDAELIPLHAQMSPQEQARAFAHYSRPKVIVATNIAEAALTVADLDAVVDSGFELEPGFKAGAYEHNVRPVPLSVRTQRRGRVGRTRPGIYIDHCPIPMHRRRKDSRPEIYSEMALEILLDLASMGLSPDKLPFFHPLTEGAIGFGTADLQRLKCLDEEGKITNLGKLIAMLPVSPEEGAIIAEAIRLGCVGDVLVPVAILEMRGILTSANVWSPEHGEDLCSDLLVQAEAFEVAERTGAYDEIGVGEMLFLRAQQTRDRLVKSLSDLGVPISSSGKTSDIIRSIVVGLLNRIHVWDGRAFVNLSKRRKRGSRSYVRVGYADCAVGVPMAYEGRTPELTLVTKFPGSLLRELRPDLPRRVMRDDGSTHVTFMRQVIEVIPPESTAVTAT